MTSLTSKSDPAVNDTRAVARRNIAQRWVASNGAWVLILDIILIIIFGLLSDSHVFLSTQNFQNLALSGTEALLLALGLAMLLGAGLFDLSLGANLVLSSIVGAKVIQSISGQFPDENGQFHSVGTSAVVGLVVCIAIGILFGLANGLIIAYLRVNSLIATLGTLGIGTGIADLINNGGDLGGLPGALQTNFALKTELSVPVPALVALALAVLFWALVRYTRFGLRTLAIGSDRTSAERAGIRVRPHVVTLAVLAGALAGLAGFIDISRFGSTTLSGHSQDALAAITAVVIGGTLLEGGRISVVGTIWGTLLAVLLQGGLVVLDVKPFWQLIAIGAVLIAAVAIDRYRFARRESS